MPINSYLTEQRSECNVLLILGYFISAYAHQLCTAAVLEFRVYSKIHYKKNTDNKSRKTWVYLKYFEEACPLSSTPTLAVSMT